MPWDVRFPKKLPKTNCTKAATRSTRAHRPGNWNPTQFGKEKMEHDFSVGDHVEWNSEAGMVSGTITKIHTKDVRYKGHWRRCSQEDPQFEIKSDKTDHVAMHKAGALKKA